MRYFLVLALGWLAISCDSKTEANGKEADAGQNFEDRVLESPDIQMTIRGFSGGTAYLIGMLNEQQYRLDTAVIQSDGSLHFKKDEPYQPGLAFLLLPDKNYFQVLIDADQTFSMTTSKGRLVSDMKVSGSLDNELLYENLRFEEAYNPKVNALNQRLKKMLPADPEYASVEAERDGLIQERKEHLEDLFKRGPNTLFTAFKKAGQNPDPVDVRKPNGQIDSTRQLYIYRAQFWDNVNFDNEVLMYTPVISNKLKRYITELTPQIADSINAAASMLVDKVIGHDEYYKYFVNWITLQYEPGKTTLMDGESVYVHMVGNYITNERAFWSDSFQVYGLQRRAKEMSLSLTGQKAQNITAKDINGKVRSLFDFTTPYVIVYLYNPDCEHCIEETPKLVRLHREWKDKGLSVWYMAVDTEDDLWRKFVASNGMQEFVNVFDPTNKSIYGKYFVDNTPELYLLNKDRTIIAKNLKVTQVADIIRRDQKKQ